MKDFEGSRKLFSLDHTDLYVADRLDSLIFAEKFVIFFLSCCVCFRKNPFLIIIFFYIRYTSCLLHGLVMQNKFNQKFLLVPNYGLRRVEIRSCPFSNPLVSTRSDKVSFLISL